ncbi:hypothetical protein V8C35DRAFT_229295 [Trichoderma chlorosporum]
MPSISIIQTAIAELPNGPPLVVAISGGTTGIGSYIAKSLATIFAKDGSKLRVYIIGRNVERAEKVISDGRELCPGSDWRFVHATDLALISEVDKCCAEISQQETESPFHGGPVRVDLLYMTHCYPILKERTTTREGLDAFLSTVYYSRMRFIMQLLPLLTASPIPGHVVSVYAGGFEDGTRAGESPIGCPPDSAYGVGGVRKYTTFMKTFLFEELAERYAGKLSLTHIYPGLVDGPGFYSPEMPRWFRVLWLMLKPLTKLYMTTPQVCGDVMMYLATARYPAREQIKDVKQLLNGVQVASSSKAEPGGGSYTVGQRGDASNKVSYEKVRREGLSEQVWNHTIKTLEQIKKQNVKVAYDSK